MTMWKVVDEVDLPGNGCQEDLAGASGPMAWVLDGASAVGNGKITRSPSDALWMVQHIDGHLAELADEDLPLRTIVARAIEATARDAAEWGWPEFPPSAALGLVRRNGTATEFLVLADVSVVLRTPAGVFEIIDRRVDRHNRPAQEAMKKVLEDPGATLADAREQARPLLADVRRQAMNRDDGYWVASIDSRAADNALVGSFEGVTELVLASDGFMRAVEFGLVDRPADLFDRDLRELADQVREEERADLHTRKHARWTVSDDICARRLRWVE
jgi:hypothetical protein